MLSVHLPLVHLLQSGFVLIVLYVYVFLLLGSMALTTPMEVD